MHQCGRLIPTIWSFSSECQEKNWLTHKYNCKTLQKINKWTAEQMEQGKMTRPPSGKCTGCGVRFTRDYGCYGTCPQCGYEACESCICHDRRGTIYPVCII